jgi:hypothetical protein
LAILKLYKNNNKAKDILDRFQKQKEKISKLYFKLIAKEDNSNIIALLLKLKGKKGYLLLLKQLNEDESSNFSLTLKCVKAYSGWTQVYAIRLNNRVPTRHLLQHT